MSDQILAILDVKHHRRRRLIENAETWAKQAGVETRRIDPEALDGCRQSTLIHVNRELRALYKQTKPGNGSGRFTPEMQSC